MAEKNIDNTKTITVIIPVYNTERYVARAIESVIRQTYYNLKIILVDDGSTDESGIICDSYAKRDKRIKVKHTLNCGVGAARNTGLNMADGTYIMFLDSDDEMPLEAVGRLVDCMERHPCGAILGGFKLCGRYDKIYTSEEREYSNHDLLYYGYMDENLKFYVSTVTATLFKREIIERNNIRFFEHLVVGEDGMFLLKYLEFVNNVLVIDNVSYYYYCFTNEERVHSVGCVYPDEYEVLLSYFNFLCKQLDSMEDEKWRPLLDCFFDILMPALVRMVAYGTYDGMELRSRMRAIANNKWVSQAAQVYRCKNKEHSRMIPYCIKKRYIVIALILLKIRRIKYFKEKSRNLQVRTIYRMNCNK